MDQDVVQRSVNFLTHRAFREYDIPFVLRACVLVTQEAVESSGCLVTVPDAKDESPETFFTDCRDHSPRIVATGACQSQLMMGMPLADMMKPIAVLEFVPDIEKIADILIEEGHLMIGFRPRANCVYHYRYSALCPIPE